MRDRSQKGHRSPIVHYGVLAIFVIILFALGTRLGTLLTQNVGQSPVPENVAATISGGAALVDPPLLVQDFTLTSQVGQPISLSDLQGQPVLLFFGYTHCPEECPLTMADFTTVKSELGDQGDDVQFVFVSVDGERDTPEVVAEFLGRFDESFIGMTGDEDSLRQLGVQFGLMVENVVLNNEGSQRPATEADENYFVTHISPSFLIDKEGYLSRVLFYGTKPDVIANNLRDFLGTS